MVHCSVVQVEEAGLWICDALFRLQPSIASKNSDFLEAFDAHRDRICKIAAKVYARGPKGSYDLQAADF